MKRRRRSDLKSGSGDHFFSFNIGTVIFGAVFVYIIIALILYFTANHVSYYQVSFGPLARNQTYSGFAVRSEVPVNADTTGYIYYYARDNTKTKRYGALFGIGLQRNAGDDISISDAAKNDIEEVTKEFIKNFDSNDYRSVQALKYDITGKLISDADAILPEGEYEPSQLQETYSVGDVTVTTSPADGIVSYITDDYEEFDESQLTPDLFDESAYESRDLKRTGEISAGDEVCKIINSEKWRIYIPLTSMQIVNLNGVSDVKVKFLSDGATETGELTILTGNDGEYYGRIDLENGLIRYVRDRFVDIELVTNTRTGLKIPVSSIVSKEFYTIPEAYAATGGDDNSEIGFMKEVFDGDRNVKHEFTTTTIYEYKDGKYYIDSEDFNEGDVIVMKNSSSERYIVGDTDTLEGVYCINKGYAVFRKILITDKNEEYCIVESGTKYGISQFDYIVLNAEEVNEEQITAK